MLVLHKNVLIQQIDKKETTTTSGLIITGTSSDNPHQKAKVISVGTGLRDVYLKVGVEVLVSKGTGTPIKGDDGIDYLLVPYESIVAVL